VFNIVRSSALAELKSHFQYQANAEQL